MTAPPSDAPRPRVPLPGLLSALPPAMGCSDPDIRVGQTLDPALRKRLMARHGGKLRILHPGDIVTMDMIPDRINITIDRQDRILTIRCG